MGFVVVSCEKTTKRSKNKVRTTKSSVVARLDNLEFGGQWPLTMRARCRAFRYCPDPLGIVTAEVLVKLELVFCYFLGISFPQQGHVIVGN